MNINKICIIHVYWGKLPTWYPYFLKSCESNGGIDFLILTENNTSFSQNSNIKFITLSMSDFKTLATEKLGMSVYIDLPYKICDFRPAFGKIFEDLLKKYDYWGYCDNDLIFGDISKFLKKLNYERYNIISFYQGFLSGPFCLYKNNKLTNELFMEGNYYKIIFRTKENLCFDENIERNLLHGVTLIKLIAFLFFLLLELKEHNIFFSRMKEIRYQFQWYYKKMQVKNISPQSMTEIVWKAGKENRINYCFKELLLSDSSLKRMGSKVWMIKWGNGNLIDIRKNKEIFAFHFVESKNSKNFSICNSDKDSFFSMIKK